MINLYKQLGYKSGKSITTALNKAEKKHLVDTHKPYERLDYSDCVEILSAIDGFIAKAKASKVESLLREYSLNVENGLSAREINVRKAIDKPVLPVVEYKSEEEVFYISEELKEVGYRVGAYTDFATVFIRFQRALGKEDLYNMMNNFINKKFALTFSTEKERKTKEKLEYWEFKFDFVKLIFTNSDLKEKYDKVHIEELIYIYKHFSNHTFTSGYGQKRLTELVRQRKAQLKKLSEIIES